ncbi:MAG TPA: glycosyltransferase [Bryobacterales bacterium]|nr:glycosyltransferase [Bryobacterales bacterium]
MPETKPGLAICIPTYRRPRLLRRLLADLAQQTLWPEQLIVVDGDPSSRDARDVAEYAGFDIPSVTYVPSNHANLPFQRYLGWRAAARQRWLVYVDDDLRVPDKEALEKLILPLEALPGEVAGVTARIEFPNRPAGHASVDESSSEGSVLRALARRFGSAHRTQAGGLTPVGYRKPPAHAAESYAATQWLRGGVMAFDRDVLDEECFGECLFALADVQAGLGEDTIISMKAARRGRLLFARYVRFVHPDDDSPKAYAFEGYRAGWAHAYSRRLINDSYRGSEPPTWADRAALVRHYLGKNLLNLRQCYLCADWDKWNFAAGYAWGTVWGLCQPPNARRLAPGVDWQRDAADCLRRATLVVREPAWR